MFPYLEKNYTQAQWFYGSYEANMLKSLKGNVKFMKQIAYLINSNTEEFEPVIGTDSISLEFNEQKEIVTKWSIRDTYETKYKSFIEDKILSVKHHSEDFVELFEYDAITGLSNKYIKINKEGSKTEQRLKIEIQKDGSIYHSDKDYDIQYDSDERIICKKANYRNFEIIYDYLSPVKKGYYTKTYHTDNEISTFEKYSYDDDTLVEKIMYRNDAVRSKQMFFYDERKRLFQCLTLYDDDSFENHYYFYNEKDLLIEDKISYPGRTMGTCDFFEYDIQDNVIKTRDNSFQYTYDQFGNWTEKLEISNEKVVQRTTREFDYFPKGLHVV
ncbi:hypothetical protein BSF41_18080 [Flavobacterium sp. ACN2]|uniref:hypothetical protein n=1 Tax=Flavobacterium sp. ACN2 TaxID=1975676 RepID=UPI000BB3747E|nr:hypothetical protein [Flavobacterium sp. ACN2]PBI90137.1 hypothetical protein BSF41_18080 [Flavobacterium sp. ACN2]